MNIGLSCCYYEFLEKKSRIENYDVVCIAMENINLFTEYCVRLLANKAGPLCDILRKAISLFQLFHFGKSLRNEVKGLVVSSIEI